MEKMYRNPQILMYNRQKAVEYAHKWAYSRNPAYFNFENWGGDCTNFVSQVIYFGSGLMNYNYSNGWYYKSSYDRSPSWTGVNFLYNFLVNNNGRGPFAVNSDITEIKPGDIIQLSFEKSGIFNHSLAVIETGAPPNKNNIFVATHSDDQDYYSLNGFDAIQTRYIHILGVRI